MAMSYTDVLDTALGNPLMERLDPLMTPVLLPFVEGIKVPINQVRGVAVTAGAAAV